MTTKIYTVPVDVLARYTATVAADYPDEATRIARDELWAHMAKAPKLITLDDVTLDGEAPVAIEAPARTFKVHGIFELAFELTVPAKDRDEAELHARRIYEANAGPFEFEHDGGHLIRLRAEEVLS